MMVLLSKEIKLSWTQVENDPLCKCACTSIARFYFEEHWFIHSDLMILCFIKGELPHTLMLWQMHQEVFNVEYLAQGHLCTSTRTTWDQTTNLLIRIPPTVAPTSLTARQKYSNHYEWMWIIWLESGTVFTGTHRQKDVWIQKYKHSRSRVREVSAAQLIEF